MQFRKHVADEAVVFEVCRMNFKQHEKTYYSLSRN